MSETSTSTATSTNSAAKPVKSLAPLGAVYLARTSLLAARVGHYISACRSVASIADSATHMLAKHSVCIANENALRIQELVMLDRTYDSEDAMATRAVRTVLEEIWGESIRVTGWLDGHRILVDGEAFITTDEECPRCQVNPLCHGIGGGERCLNSRECGYSYCA